MASSVGRYTIVSPATSRILREVLDDAIENGSRTAQFTAADENDTKIEVIFTLSQARYDGMNAEYIGNLADGGVATVKVTIHPDFEDAPARLTLVRRATAP